MPLLMMRRIYLMCMFWMMLFILPVIVPFFQSKGLSMTEVFELQAIFSFAIVIFEVPSGYFSDLFGRKTTLIIACLCHGISFTLFPYLEDFWDFVYVECFMAIGTSLLSGTDISLLYDWADETGDKEVGVHVLGNRIMYSQIGEVTASILGGLIAAYSLKVNAYVNAVVSWIPFFIALFIKEPKFEKLNKVTHKENFKLIFKKVFIEDPLLRLLVFNFMFYSASTLIAVWTFQAYWKKLGIGYEWFGTLWAIQNILVAFFAKMAPRFERKLGSFSSLIIIGILPMISFTGMGIFHSSLFGLFFCLLFQLERGLAQVIIKHGINSRVPSQFRATTNSLGGLGVRLFFVLCGPLMGHLMDNNGHDYAFKVFGAIYFAVFIFFMIPLLLKRKDFVEI